ncbi:hypothetical protein CHS0354_009002 [Potamilus streckersoni]|uniref:Uncharacterized protein n=1 Tax=Potamilus streckersoni TaxID=2493646 RepID=A0AAE0THL8_9BIVA|nr:hypothetical protein CHS0354_009002 [Potamilus streckersoni]
MAAISYMHYHRELAPDIQFLERLDPSNYFSTIGHKGKISVAKSDLKKAFISTI